MKARITDDAELTARAARIRAVPILSTLIGSAMALGPFVGEMPLAPPFGLLVILAWRMLRPELWPSWAPFVLGLADDLMSGQVLGTSAMLWTLSFLILDLLDTRVLWRDYWIDWGVASALVGFCLVGGWLSATYIGSGGPVTIILPQLLLSVLCIPPVMRLCGKLDRWRLS